MASVILSAAPSSGLRYKQCVIPRHQALLWLHTRDHRLVSCRIAKAYRRDGPVERNVVCKARRAPDEGFVSNAALRLVLWSMTGFYAVWLFILPYAPGDPAWAIDQETLSMLFQLSLNFFFVLPIANAAGFHVVTAPVVHPAAEALFNIVMGWTLLFGPIIFSDARNNRFKGSLEALWAGQWFLTNAFLIPYMAIRLNEQVPTKSQSPSKFCQAALSAAKPIALVGGIVGALSIAWGLGGRPDAGFGNIVDRWNYFLHYIGTDRVAYAFLWDVFLYSIFQVWLVQSNLKKVEGLRMRKMVSLLSYVPYVGSVAYLWGLASEIPEMTMSQENLPEESK
ncbi:hypothetical protein SELMODRAFT_172377 [Selaginella moellendorffii]|uniref:Uncharacterized protein n=2 Tax=Selaginella moellendorffii TaxID=88036 RepID=D8RL28_SELML|nr:hypothetical protein SELMODRAFT_172377 [Selaginella moellendorffii]